jgi:predicted alpha/beta hydrolase family esterase
MSEPTFIYLPGYEGSGPTHWQSLWNEKIPNSIFAEQENWVEPELGKWLEGLDKAIRSCSSPVILVCHSIGCSLAAHWLKNNEDEAAARIAGAMLVSPADVDDKDWTPDVVRCFAPLPLGKMPFPSLVVMSEDDPYASQERMKFFAECWGSDIVSVGEKGHISDMGDWPEGQEMLAGLTK